MKYISCALLPVLLCACHPLVPPKTDDALHQRMTHLLEKYKPLCFDTLTIDTPGNGGFDNYSYRFHGCKTLDSTEIALLPDAANMFNNGDPVWACFRFPMDSGRIGLITRGGGEYGATQVHLLVLDTATAMIGHAAMLEESWGDAGDAYGLSSWLFKNGKQLQCLQFALSMYDHSVEDPADTTVAYNRAYSLLQLHLQGAALVSGDSAALARQFPRLLKDTL